MNFMITELGTLVRRLRSDRGEPTPLSAVRRLQQQPRIVKALGFLSLFLLVATLDFFLDPNLSLFVLYLIPTLYAAWFLGTRWGHAVVWQVPRSGPWMTGGVRFSIAIR